MLCKTVWVNNHFVRTEAGGACVIKIGPDIIEHFSRKGVSAISLFSHIDFKRVGDYIIFMDVSLKSLLNEKEIKAVLDHEKGHIIHEHHGKPDSVQKEIEADAYSAKINGKQTMINALIKSGHVNNPDVQIRLKALGYKEPKPGITTEAKVAIAVVALAVVGYMAVKWGE